MATPRKKIKSLDSKTRKISEPIIPIEKVAEKEKSFAQIGHSIKSNEKEKEIKIEKIKEKNSKKIKISKETPFGYRVINGKYFDVQVLIGNDFIILIINLNFQ